MSTTTPITTDAFTARLDAIREAAGPDSHGLFGPDSMMWKIASSNVCFISSWRAAMLQLAHPWVAAAVRDHSRTADDPIGRFHGTFQTVLRMLYGTTTQAMGVSERLHKFHGTITGTVGEGQGESAYGANVLEAMVWVNATLWETLVLTHETLFGPIPDADKERFYDETKRFAALFGIPDRALPATWADFLTYNQDMWHSETLRVIPSALEMSRFLFKVNKFPFVKPACQMGRRYTLTVLPEPIKAMYELPDLTKWERRRLAFDLKWLRFYDSFAPDILTKAPTHLEAVRRVEKGKPATFPIKVMTRITLGTWQLV